MTTRLLARYPLVIGTLLVCLVGGMLQLAGFTDISRYVISGYAAGVAVWEAWGMLRQLRHGRIGIDLLAVASIAATLAVGEYWASIIIVLMLTGGLALEDYAGHRARHELRALMQNAPLSAHRVGAGGEVTDVVIDEVEPDDIVAVHPGEVLPVDGILVSETAVLDESQLTGESLPVERRSGDTVLSGTVNREISIIVRATVPAAQSQYQRIVDLVSEASESSAPLVRLADRYAVPFTIVAFAIAGLAWYLSGDPRRFAEVLVVATPCPLLLAAPIAFIGGVGRAAKSGIVVKSGTTLEQLSRVKAVAFDKTGTLTHGTPEVVALEPADGFGKEDLLSLAASVEQYSGHVLAAALLEYAKARRGVVIRPAEQATEVTASGMTAVVDGQVVAVGKRAWIASLGADVRSEPPQFGEMAVYVAVEKSYRGQIRFADRVRTNTGEVVSALGRLGVRRIMMLTGDLAATAEHIATGAGIKEVLAECLPADKVAAVRAVETRPLMMVGDGVNDAPVLAAADIGVAMGARGSTAATESADVVIMVDDLSRVVRAVVIGRRTTTVALQSIWLGMTLSIGLMIVACFGLLPAVIGAALQEGVDLVTILFALRGRSAGPGDREAPARSDSQGAEAFRPA